MDLFAFRLLSRWGTDPLPISGLDWDETKSFEHPRSTEFPTEPSIESCTLLCLDFSDYLMRDLTADVYYAVQVIRMQQTRLQTPSRRRAHRPCR